MSNIVNLTDKKADEINKAVTALLEEFEDGQIIVIGINEESCKFLANQNNPAEINLALDLAKRVVLNTGGVEVS